MTLEDAIEAAAGGLNYGWSISIDIEEGYAGIRLGNDEGEEVPVDCPECASLAEQILMCMKISHGIEP